MPNADTPIAALHQLTSAITYPSVICHPVAGIKLVNILMDPGFLKTFGTILDMYMLKAKLPDHE